MADPQAIWRARRAAEDAAAEERRARYTAVLQPTRTSILDGLRIPDAREMAAQAAEDRRREAQGTIGPGYLGQLHQAEEAQARTGGALLGYTASNLARVPEWAAGALDLGMQLPGMAHRGGLDLEDHPITDAVVANTKFLDPVREYNETMGSRLDPVQRLIGDFATPVGAPGRLLGAATKPALEFLAAERAGARNAVGLLGDFGMAGGPPVKRPAGLGGARIPGSAPVEPRVVRPKGRLPYRVPEVDPQKYGVVLEKRSGRMVGAPQGKDRPVDFERSAQRYAARVNKAIAAGVQRDYFYGAARKSIAEVVLPKDRRKLAHILSVTSPQDTVLGNANSTAKALDQSAGGFPISAGRFPNTMRPKIETSLAGGRPDFGRKTGPFDAGLGGTGPLEEKHPMLQYEGRRGPLGVNDMHEARGTGYKSDTLSDRQHDYVHAVRERAVEILNNTEQPWHFGQAGRPQTGMVGGRINPLQAQELHWATVRAGPGASDESIRQAGQAYPFTFASHTWETTPGVVSKHLRGFADPAGDYNRAVRDVTVDPLTGRDRLVDVYGGTIQRPAEAGVSAYKGVVGNEGVVSQSGVAMQGRGLDPASRARLEITENDRAWRTGQDAAATSVLTGPQRSPRSRAYQTAHDFELGHRITPAEAQVIMDHTGMAAIPSRTGGYILDIPSGAVPDSGLTGLERKSAAAASALGAPPPTLYGFESTYKELPWARRGVNQGATADLLRSMNPEQLRRFNSAESRTLSARYADVIDARVAKGEKETPGLAAALRAHARGGSVSLARLVQLGLAPAVAFALLQTPSAPSPTEGPNLRAE